MSLHLHGAKETGEWGGEGGAGGRGRGSESVIEIQAFIVSLCLPDFRPVRQWLGPPPCRIRLAVFS